MEYAFTMQVLNTTSYITRELNSFIPRQRLRLLHQKVMKAASIYVLQTETYIYYYIGLQ